MSLYVLFIQAKMKLWEVSYSLSLILPLLLSRKIEILHSINQIFVPLQAKDMVTLSKTISQKIKDKQGDITEDEVNPKNENAIWFSLRPINKKVMINYFQLKSNYSKENVSTKRLVFKQYHAPKKSYIHFFETEMFILCAKMMI